MVNPGKSDSTTMQQKKHLDCTSWHVVRSKFGGLQLFLLLSGFTPAARHVYLWPSHQQLTSSIEVHLTRLRLSKRLFGGFALNFVVNLHDLWLFFKEVFIHIINLNHFTYEYLCSCTRRLALFSLGSTCMLYFLLISTSSSFRFQWNYVPHLLQSQLHIGQWQANGHRRAGKAWLRSGQWRADIVQLACTIPIKIIPFILSRIAVEKTKSNACKWDMCKNTLILELHISYKSHQSSKSQFPVIDRWFPHPSTISKV